MKRGHLFFVAFLVCIPLISAFVSAQYSGYGAGLDILYILQKMVENAKGLFTPLFQSLLGDYSNGDTLFVKITEQGKTFAGKHYKEGEAYPGSKPYMEIGGELLEDSAWLTELIEITAEALPIPKPKKKKSKK